MATTTQTHEPRVNNATVRIETAGDPTVTPGRLLSETRFHPGSYALFVDAYADDEDAPAVFDERCGERIELDETVDVSEHRQFVAILKRTL